MWNQITYNYSPDSSIYIHKQLKHKDVQTWSHNRTSGTGPQTVMHTRRFSDWLAVNKCGPRVPHIDTHTRYFGKQLMDTFDKTRSNIHTLIV